MGARLQHAELYNGTVQDGAEEYLFFGFEGIPSVNTAFRWYEIASDFGPGLSVDWLLQMPPRAPNTAVSISEFTTRRANAPSTVVAKFSWCHPSDVIDQPLADACLTLEHYVDWK